MPTFDYTALSTQGRRERGSVDAESAAEARRKLRAARVHVVELADQATDADRVRALARRRIRPRELAGATRQLATLLRAGMPLVPAIGALIEQLSPQPLARVFASVRERVNDGATLAAALSRQPRAFSQLYVSLVRSGEAAGALEPVLFRLADMLDRRVELANKVKAATAYPLLVAGVSLAVVAFLLSCVIPSIGKLFADMNRDLPWPTEALMAASAFTQRYLWAVGLAAAGAALAARLWVKTAAGRSAWDRLKLRLPLVGELARKMAVARFARTLGVLLASGVSILDALEIVRHVVGNTVLAGALEAARHRVREGDSLAAPLRRSGAFPPIVCHMIATGEASGQIEEGLLNVADAYDNDVHATVGALTSLLEPIMILVMGTIVGFIVLAILLPIFEINQAIR